jgi:DNA-binding IclR family transcriptional regulator
VADLKEPELRQFLFDTVEGVEDLQVLVWFHEQPRGCEASPKRIAEQTGMLSSAALEALTRLVEKGLVSCVDSQGVAFRYDPKDPSVHALLAAVLEQYRTSAVQILKILTANAIERVKTAALRRFAESFRIRGPR